MCHRRNVTKSRRNLRPSSSGRRHGVISQRPVNLMLPNMTVPHLTSKYVNCSTVRIVYYVTIFLLYLNYLSNMITNDARCTREIKSRIVMAKAAFNRKRTLFTSSLGLTCEEESSEVTHVEQSFLWC